MSHTGTDAPLRDCLIAVVNNDRDLERFTHDGCYRIPGRAIGRAISPRALEESRVLALYQTSSISAGLRGAVELWGEIAEVSWRTRRELIPEEPDHPAADEPYRLIRVTAVEHLDRPVVSRRPRRVTFVRTTRDRLFGAAEVNDLFVGSEQEEALWRALSGLDVERRYLMTVRETVMEVDFAIFQEDRAIGIVCGDPAVAEPWQGEQPPGAWLLIRFSQAELEGNLKECIGRITSLLEGRTLGIAGGSAAPGT
jgi:hypothetical protein